MNFVLNSLPYCPELPDHLKTVGQFWTVFHSDFIDKVKSFINDLSSDFVWKHIFPFIWCFANIRTRQNLLSWTISVFQVTPLCIWFFPTQNKHAFCQDSEFNIWGKCFDCLARTKIKQRKSNTDQNNTQLTPKCHWQQIRSHHCTQTLDLSGITRWPDLPGFTL